MPFVRLELPTPSRPSAPAARVKPSTRPSSCDVSPSDVIIHLVETLRENWSFGQGVAHYTCEATA